MEGHKARRREADKCFFTSFFLSLTILTLKHVSGALDNEPRFESATPILILPAAAGDSEQDGDVRKVVFRTPPLEMQLNLVVSKFHMSLGYRGGEVRLASMTTGGARCEQSSG